MSDRYESQGAALIQFYGWLRETGEIDRLVDLVIEKVRDASQTERAKDPEPVDAESRLAAALDALRDQARCPECGKDTCDLHHVLNMAEAAKTIVVKTRVLLARAALAGGGR